MTSFTLKEAALAILIATLIRDSDILVLAGKPDDVEKACKS